MEAILNSTFKQMEDITDIHEMTDTQLKCLIQKIEVDKDGNVDIYLRLIGDLGLDETVLIDATGNADEGTSDAEKSEEIVRRTGEHGNRQGDNQEKQAKSKENTDAKANIGATTKTIPNTHPHTHGLPEQTAADQQYTGGGGKEGVGCE